MSAQKAAEAASRVFANPKGIGGGIGLLAAAGGLAYGAYQSFFTSMFLIGYQRNEMNDLSIFSRSRSSSDHV